MAANGTATGIINAGGAIVEILATYGFVTTPPPTQADLQSWISQHNLPVSTFIDAPSTPIPTITAFEIRETALIVQLPSMQVAWVDHGDVTGFSASSIIAATAEMHMLLGK